MSATSESTAGTSKAVMAAAVLAGAAIAALLFATTGGQSGDNSVTFSEYLNGVTVTLPDGGYLGR